jgi:anti-sigma regulatory factor (Ser/Thr protein kinase)/DNA-binding response OmpR family regulator
MTIPLKVLLVEDSEADAVLLKRQLRIGGYEPTVVRVETREQMIAALSEEGWQIVVSDYRLPAFSGPEALETLHEIGRDIPFIIVSGTVGETNAVDAMKAGANDYVMKDNLLRLVPAITRELHEAEGRRLRRTAEMEREAMRLENENLLREKAAAAMQQRAFLKDVLLSVTQGKLCLCDSPADFPSPPMPFLEPVTLSAATLRQARLTAEAAARRSGLPDERVIDIVTAVAEACMNSVVHAGGGEIRFYAEDGRVQVWIMDRGRGIDIKSLPRATLERGYTTANSLGHGFFMMLGCADRVYLLTGMDGTTIVLEQYYAPPAPAWLERDSAWESMADPCEFAPEMLV